MTGRSEGWRRSEPRISPRVVFDETNCVYPSIYGRRRPKVGKARVQMTRRLEWLAGIVSREEGVGVRAKLTELRAVAHVLEVFDLVHVPAEPNEARRAFLSTVDPLDVESIRAAFREHCGYLDEQIMRRRTTRRLIEESGRTAGEEWDTWFGEDELRSLVYGLEVFEEHRREQEEVSVGGRAG